LRLLKRRTRFEVADAEEKTRLALRHIAGEALRRHPDFDLSIEGMLEGAGDDADDAVGLTIEDDFLAGQIGVGVQVALPEALVDDDDALSARLIFAACERPPDD